MNVFHISVQDTDKAYKLPIETGNSFNVIVRYCVMSSQYGCVVVCVNVLACGNQNVNNVGPQARVIFWYVIG